MPNAAPEKIRLIPDEWHIQHVGRLADGRLAEVRIAPESTPARNDAFDVTPARLVTGLVTERGICPASREGLAALFPEAAARRAS